jgi:hypothetical protein
MPIRSFLDGNSPFDPEHIQSMSTALADVLKALELTDKNGDLTVIIAKKIIELAKTGERDPARLRDAALKSLRQ